LNEKINSSFSNMKVNQFKFPSKEGLGVC